MTFISDNNLKTEPANNLLWLLQAVFACGIVIWRINPVSRDMNLHLFLVAGWIAVTFLLYGPNLFSLLVNRKSICYMLAWPMILLLYSIVEHATFSMSYILDLACMNIGLFYLLIKDYKSSFVIVIVTAIYLSIICINTQIAYFVHPTISRIISVGDKSGIVYYESYITPFIAGYDVIYGLVFCVTAIGIYLKTIKKNALFLLVFFLLFFSTVVRAQFFIAISMVLSSFVVIFIINDTSKNEKIIKSLTLSVFSMFTLFFAPIILNYIADNFDLSSNITFRLRDLAYALSGNVQSHSDVSSRMTVYNISVNNFFDHMLFGVGDKDNLYVGYGNHSTILDCLAKYGIIGGFAYILFHLGPLFAILSSFRSKEKNGMIIVIALLFVLGVINKADTRINYALIYIAIPLFFNIMSRYDGLVRVVAK